jgi:hypothetical protein
MPRTLLRTVFNVNENFGVTQDYHEISEGWFWWSVESWRTYNEPDEAQGKEEIGDAQSKDSY